MNSHPSLSESSCDKIHRMDEDSGTSVLVTSMVVGVYANWSQDCVSLGFLSKIARYPVDTKKGGS